MRTITKCRSCGSVELSDLLSLGELHLSAFLRPGEEAPRYPLDLILCHTCNLVQLRHTVPAEEMYRNYWYRSGTNKTMTEELHGIAREAAKRAGLQAGDVVLDIGCNDGTLLRGYDLDLDTVGFEPSDMSLEACEHVDLVIHDFFNAAEWEQLMKSKKARVVTSIAMFYDLDDPNTFVHDVAQVLADDGIWIIQMADLKSMLDRTMWDNICHEHLEYYSLTSLEHLLHRHGFVVVDVETNDVNGGSLRAYVQKQPAVSNARVRAMREAEAAMGLDTRVPYVAFAQRVHEMTLKLRSFVEQEKRQGRSIYVYGASTKGNTLLQYAKLGCDVITAAADRNPDKWGLLTVGTRIPIIDEKAARAAKPDYFLVLPWHFMKEFLEREQDYLAAGGAFIIPLPEFTVVRADGVSPSWRQNSNH